MKIRFKQGFTLPELLISTFILVVAVAGVLGVLGKMTLLSELNRETTLATQHGQYVLESLKNADFAGLETAINNGEWNYSAGQLAGAPFNFMVLDDETITTRTLTSGSSLHIVVTVEWKMRTGAARLLTVETLRTEW